MVIRATTSELISIVNDMENICIRMQNVNFEGVEKYDKLTLMHNVQQLAQLILKQAS